MMIKSIITITNRIFTFSVTVSFFSMIYVPISNDNGVRFHLLSSHTYKKHASTNIHKHKHTHIHNKKKKSCTTILTWPSKTINDWLMGIDPTFHQTRLPSNDGHPSIHFALLESLFYWIMCRPQSMATGKVKRRKKNKKWFNGRDQEGWVTDNMTRRRRSNK